MTRKNNLRKNNVLRVILGMVIVVLVNVIASFLFTRFDLTAEKRYTLSPATKSMLRNLSDDVFFRVYLEG